MMAKDLKKKILQKYFKRFYSNRPDKFGEHSGLGLNIVKNLVDLHDGEIVASNRLDREGAIVEISFQVSNLNLICLVNCIKLFHGRL